MATSGGISGDVWNGVATSESGDIERRLATGDPSATEARIRRHTGRCRRLSCASAATGRGISATGGGIRQGPRASQATTRDKRRPSTSKATGTEKSGDDQGKRRPLIEQQTTMPKTRAPTGGHQRPLRSTFGDGDKEQTRRRYGRSRRPRSSHGDTDHQATSTPFSGDYPLRRQATQALSRRQTTRGPKSLRPPRQRRAAPKRRCRRTPKTRQQSTTSPSPSGRSRGPLGVPRAGPPAPCRVGRAHTRRLW